MAFDRPEPAAPRRSASGDGRPRRLGVRERAGAAPDRRCRIPSRCGRGGPGGAVCAPAWAPDRPPDPDRDCGRTVAGRPAAVGPLHGRSGLFHDGRSDRSPPPRRGARLTPDARRRDRALRRRCSRDRKAQRRLRGLVDHGRVPGALGSVPRRAPAPRRAVRIGARACSPGLDPARMAGLSPSALPGRRQCAVERRSGRAGGRALRPPGFAAFVRARRLVLVCAGSASPRSARPRR